MNQPQTVAVALPVIPAKAGVWYGTGNPRLHQTPAFAGVTGFGVMGEWVA